MERHFFRLFSSGLSLLIIYEHYYACYPTFSFDCVAQWSNLKDNRTFFSVFFICWTAGSLSGRDVIMEDESVNNTTEEQQYIAEWVPCIAGCPHEMWPLQEEWATKTARWHCKYFGFRQTHFIIMTQAAKTNDSLPLCVPEKGGHMGTHLELGAFSSAVWPFQPCLHKCLYAWGKNHRLSFVLFSPGSFPSPPGLGTTWLVFFFLV